MSLVAPFTTTKNFNKYQLRPFLTVMKETEKAVMVESMSPYGQAGTMWLPKSQIKTVTTTMKNINGEDVEKTTIIELSDWLCKKHGYKVVSTIAQLRKAGEDLNSTESYIKKYFSEY